MALLVTAGDDEGDFNTPDLGVLLGSKGTGDCLAGLSSELRSIFLNSDRRAQHSRLFSGIKHLLVKKINDFTGIHLTEAYRKSAKKYRDINLYSYRLICLIMISSTFSQ